MQTAPAPAHALMLWSQDQSDPIRTHASSAARVRMGGWGVPYGGMPPPLAPLTAAEREAAERHPYGGILRWAREGGPWGDGPARREAAWGAFVLLAAPRGAAARRFAALMRREERRRLRRGEDPRAVGFAVCADLITRALRG